MTPADPAGAARPNPDGARSASPPPPRYQPSDEISLDDPIIDAAPSETEADAARPTASFDGPEPLDTPTRRDQRPGRPFRVFWLPNAANSSAAGIVVGGILFSTGMSLRQSLLAGVIGVVLSGVLLAAVSRAGRRSGLPVLSASAGVFGSRGNLLPAAIVLIARVVIAGVLLWMFAASLGRVTQLVGAPAGSEITVVFLAAGAVLAGASAAAGYRVIVVVTRILAPVAAVALLWFIAVTLPTVDLPVALTIGDGPGVLVASGAVLVFVLGGLLLVPAGGDISRFQDARSSGVATNIFAALTGVPVLIIVSYGAVLAASSPATAAGLLTSPVDAVVALLPPWYPLPLAIGLTVNLLCASTLSLYSGGLALIGAGARIGLPPTVAVLTVVSVGIASVVVISPGDDTPIDLVTTVAVPLAAWAGVLLSRLLVRPESGLDQSAQQPVRWFAVVTVVISTAVGFGLTTAATDWLSWQGYFFTAIGAQPDSVVAASDIGVLIALLVSALAVSLQPRSRSTARRVGSHRMSPNRGRAADES